MTYIASGTANTPHLVIDADYAETVMSYGTVVELTDEIRQLLPRVVASLGERIALGRIVTRGFLVRTAVIEAFGVDSELESGMHQHRCNIARTLYDLTHRTLSEVAQIH